MNNLSNHLHPIQVDAKTLRVGERYIFHIKSWALYKEPPFSGTIEYTSATGIVIKNRYQLSPYRSILPALTIPAEWINVSSLDIPCLPEEIGRLIQQY